MAIQSNRMSYAEHRRNVHHVDAPVGDTLADMLNPAYWAHVARLLKPLDVIEVVNEANSFEASFRVISCDTNWAKVALRSHTEYQGESYAPPSAAAQYEIKHGGNHWKFQVVRLSDKEVVMSRLNTKAEAEEWLKQHLLTLNRTAPKAAAE